MFPLVEDFLILLISSSILENTLITGIISILSKFSMLRSCVKLVLLSSLVGEFGYETLMILSCEEKFCPFDKFSCINLWFSALRISLFFCISLLFSFKLSISSYKPFISKFSLACMIFVLSLRSCETTILLFIFTSFKAMTSFSIF